MSKYFRPVHLTDGRGAVVRANMGHCVAPFGANSEAKGKFAQRWWFLHQSRNHKLLLSGINNCQSVSEPLWCCQLQGGVLFSMLGEIVEGKFCKLETQLRGKISSSEHANYLPIFPPTRDFLTMRIALRTNRGIYSGVIKSYIPN